MKKCKKQSYGSKQEAKTAAMALKAKRFIKKKANLYPYFCQVHQKWHLTSKGQKGSQRKLHYSMDEE